MRQGAAAPTEDEKALWSDSKTAAGSGQLRRAHPAVKRNHPDETRARRVTRDRLMSDA
jgi:hypothetical protein